jgi:hypothetical protein
LVFGLEGSEPVNNAWRSMPVGSFPCLDRGDRVETREEIPVSWRYLAVLVAVALAAPQARAADPPAKFDAGKGAKVVVQAEDVDPAQGATSPGTPIVEEVPPAASPSAAVEPQEVVAEDAAPAIASEVIQPEEVIHDGYKTCFIEDFNFDYPMWYVRADGNWLNRTTQTETTTATVLFADGTVGNNRIISQEFDAAPGMRAFFGRNIWDGMTYVEMGYFGLNHWDELTELNRVNGLGIIKSNLDLGFGTGTDPVFQRVAYSSTIHNAELNVRTFFSPRFAFVGGLRYFNLNETLVIGERGTVVTTIPGTTSTGTFDYFNWRNVSTDNNILGPQAGLDWAYEITDDVRINLLSRAVLGANFSQSTVRQQRDAIDQINQIPIRDARVVNDEEAVICGMIELHSSLDVLLTRNILFRGGFQFLWVSGIAVAPEQHADAITNPNGVQRQIENGADAIFFGPFVGLEVYWGGVNY